MHLHPTKLCFVCFLIGSQSLAQDIYRGHVYLPPTRGATVLSTYIDAEARRLVAAGDFLESQAIARRIHAQTDRIAMENAVLWVETYFAKREINKKHRAPQGLERIKNAEYKKIQRIFEMDPDVSGDPSDEMNTMADLLLRDSSIYRSVYFADGVASDGIDIELTDSDLKHLMLREATAVHSTAKAFRPGKPEVINTNWPAIFRTEDFVQERARYDAVRGQLRREIAADNVSYDTHRALRDALDAVQAKYDEVYGARMLSLLDTAAGVKEFTFLRKTANNFFTSQAISSLDAVASNNLDAYSTNYVFAGGTLFDLLRHCAQNGLEFSKPEKGDENTYRKLFQHMRFVCENLLPSDIRHGK